jgi:hypothetical protein
MQMSAVNDLRSAYDSAFRRLVDETRVWQSLELQPSADRDRMEETSRRVEDAAAEYRCSRDRLAFVLSGATLPPSDCPPTQVAHNAR